MSRITARTKKQPTPEQIVTRQCKDFLLYRNWRPLRMQRTVIPGAFQAGEAGIADYCMLRYDQNDPQFALVLWIEFKSPRGTVKPDQTLWHLKERTRGGIVWVVDDFVSFEQRYVKEYGWLHSGEAAHGQTEMRFDAKAEAKPFIDGLRPFAEVEG